MLTPEQLEAVSNDISLIYSKTESACIEAVVKRLTKGTLSISDANAWRLRKLNEAGLLRKELISIIAKESRQSLPMVKELIENAIKKSYGKELSIVKGITFTEAVEIAVKSAEFQRSVEVALKGITNILNVTNTKALQSALKLYTDGVNEAYYSMRLGLSDYGKAIRTAVKGVGDTGVTVTSLKEGWGSLGSTYVNYQSTEPNVRPVNYPVDSAIRRAVSTTLNQSSIEDTLAFCRENGVHYVQTSSHLGARPTHAEWQGQVFSIDPNYNDYPQLVDATGYGQVDGLGGINCRHSIFACPDGKAEDEPTIDPKENEKAYKEQQTQRYYENTIRKLKRMQIAQRSDLTQFSRQDAEYTQQKINNVMKNYTSFLEQTGRTRQTMLDQVSGYHPIKVH